MFDSYRSALHERVWYCRCIDTLKSRKESVFLVGASVDGWNRSENRVKRGWGSWGWSVVRCVYRRGIHKNGGKKGGGMGGFENLEIGHWVKTNRVGGKESCVWEKWQKKEIVDTPWGVKGNGGQAVATRMGGYLHREVDLYTATSPAQQPAQGRTSKNCHSFKIKNRKIVLKREKDRKAA